MRGNYFDNLQPDEPYSICSLVRRILPVPRVGNYAWLPSPAYPQITESAQVAVVSHCLWWLLLSDGLANRLGWRA